MQYNPKFESFLDRMKGLSRRKDVVIEAIKSGYRICCEATVKKSTGIKYCPKCRGTGTVGKRVYSIDSIHGETSEWKDKCVCDYCGGTGRLDAPDNTDQLIKLKRDAELARGSDFRPTTDDQNIVDINKHDCPDCGGTGTMAKRKLVNDPTTGKLTEVWENATCSRCHGTGTVMNDASSPKNDDIGADRNTALAHAKAEELGITSEKVIKAAAKRIDQYDQNGPVTIRRMRAQKNIGLTNEEIDDVESILDGLHKSKQNGYADIKDRLNAMKNGLEPEATAKVQPVVPTNDNVATEPVTVPYPSAKKPIPDEHHASMAMDITAAPTALDGLDFELPDDE